MKNIFISVFFIMASSCNVVLENEMTDSIVGSWTLSKMNNPVDSSPISNLTWEFQDEEILIEKGCNDTQCWQHQFSWNVKKDSLHLFLFDQNHKSGKFTLTPNELTVRWGESDEWYFISISSNE